MQALRKTLLASALCLGLNGCVYGYIYDASSGSALEGVTVTVATGTCSGSGCATPITQTSETGGIFIFDAYGNRHGEDNVQIIQPASGEEAIRLVYSRAGYQSVTVYHRPNYETVTQEGVDYLVSNVQTVYLCPTGSADSDGDGVCNHAEERYGTNPNNSDTDGDRLSDFAELYGYGGVDLRYFGTNPLKKDILVEVDYYADRRPTDAALERVRVAFANAPVSNPDGTTGINLHSVLDQQIAAADADPDLDGNWVDFSVIKAKYFKARRSPFFHYAVFANTHSGGTSSGKSRGIPGQDFIVTLGGWSVPGGTEAQQAGTYMHELGHGIGLRHGGNEDLPNYKPNYFSVMNYRFQMPGLRVDGTDGVLDYSRVRVGSVSEASLSEVNAFSAVAPTTEADLAHYGVTNGSYFTGNASANLDFNRNGVINTGTVSADLDGNGSAANTFNASQHDWLALVYTGAGAIGDPHLGVSQLKAGPEFIVAPERVDSCLTAPESPRK